MMAESSFDSEYEQGFLVGTDLKLEPTSPPMSQPALGTGRYTFSRTSSTGSLHTSSSAHNTEELELKPPIHEENDENSDDKSTISYKERRREAHTQAEQKRRDAIKKGYDQLQDLVPMCQQQDSLSGYKLSKATVLQRSIDYIQYLIQQKKKHEDDIAALKKEVMALQIMKTNYEQIVQAHQSQPNQANSQLTDEIKFCVFQTIMDNLFQSFNTNISVANFGELSACVFSWLEEYCKPQTLRESVLSILRQLNSQLK